MSAAVGVPSRGQRAGDTARIWPNRFKLNPQLTTVAPAGRVNARGYPLGVSRRPHRCPECAGELARVVYGLLMEPPGPGKIAGGCVQTPSSPRWRCLECGRGWQRLPVGAADG